MRVSFADSVKSQFVDAIVNGRSLTDVVSLTSYLFQTLLEIEVFGPLEQSLKDASGRREQRRRFRYR